MAATELLCRLFGINPDELAPEENLILEVELFTRICEELKEVYKAKNKNYFTLMNVNHEKERTMLEARFLQFVINDIVITEDYSLAGIAYHTNVPEDVINDIAIGKNRSPSLQVSQKIIDLHRLVRPDIYKEVVKKVSHYFVSEAQ